MTVVQEAIRYSVLHHDIVNMDDPATFDELRAAAEGWIDGADGYEFWGTDPDGGEWRVHMDV